MSDPTEPRPTITWECDLGLHTSGMTRRYGADEEDDEDATCKSPDDCCARR